MATNDFSLKRFFGIAQVASVVAGVGISLAVGRVGNWDEVMLRAIAGGLLGFLVSGCFYLVFLAKEMLNLKIPEEELNESEVVLRQSASIVGHYRSGRPHRFWDGAGGRLFLTNQVLEFRAYKGQRWVYRLTIPLADIARAEPCRILGVFPGGLRIERVSGSFELFRFLAYGDDRGWASAIMTVCSMGHSDRT